MSLPFALEGNQATHDELLALVDAVLSEAPTEAADIAGELAAIVSEHRGDRCTERPGANERWDR